MNINMHASPTWPIAVHFSLENGDFSSSDSSKLDDEIKKEIDEIE